MCKLQTDLENIVVLVLGATQQLIAKGARILRRDKKKIPILLAIKKDDKDVHQMDVVDAAYVVQNSDSAEIICIIHRGLDVSVFPEVDSLLNPHHL